MTCFKLEAHKRQHRVFKDVSRDSSSPWENSAGLKSKCNSWLDNAVVEECCFILSVERKQVFAEEVCGSIDRVRKRLARLVWPWNRVFRAIHGGRGRERDYKKRHRWKIYTTVQYDIPGSSYSTVIGTILCSVGTNIVPKS